MKWKVETNDLLYDGNKNIIRQGNPPKFLIGSPTCGEIVHLAFPILLNNSILTDCCKFTTNNQTEFEKNGIKVTLEIDCKYHVNGKTILWLNELQQIYRNLTKQELNVDITNIQKYI